MKSPHTYLVIGGQAVGMSDDLVVVLPQYQEQPSNGPVPDGVLASQKFRIGRC